MHVFSGFMLTLMCRLEVATVLFSCVDKAPLLIAASVI